MKRRLRNHLSAGWFIGLLSVVVTGGLSALPASPSDEPGPAQIPTSSLYITVRDGTRLAIEIFRPAPVSRDVDPRRFPLILRATPYHRNVTPGSHSDGLVRALLAHGYIVALLDLRGHGASFGTMYGGGFDGARDRRDLYDVIEWLAAQPWCTGNIGMMGGSYEGLAQFWAATAMPPHLKALALSAAPLDWYASYRVNGVLQRGASEGWDEVVRTLDTKNPGIAVETDSNHQQLDEAIREHISGWQSGVAGATPLRILPYRDSVAPMANASYEIPNWWNYASNFQLARIPVLQFAGWSDKFVDQSLALYQVLHAYGVPQRLVVGPWYHGAWYHSGLADVVKEHLDWFDHWLKNSAAAPPPDFTVKYYIRGAEAGHEWHSATTWPLPGTSNQNYILDPALRLQDENERGSAVSAIGEQPCPAPKDFSTANILTRWNFVDNGAPTLERGLLPVPMDELNQKGLSYTTEPFAADVTFVGFPTIDVWVRTTRPGDIFAYIEEVDEAGHSTLLADGCLRVGAAALATPPFPNAGLPWHSGLSSARLDDTDGLSATELKWSLYPLSNRIRKGHRLRLMFSGYDAAGWDTPVTNGAPALYILYGPSHQSILSLPVSAY